MKKHQSLKKNLTTEELSKLDNLTLSRGKTCNKIKHCAHAMASIQRLWQKLDNKIRLTSIDNLGNRISNFNYLLESWKHLSETWHVMSQSNGSKILQRTIYSLMKQVYPSLLIDDLSFIDMLGLLGYNKEVDLVSINDPEITADSINYNAMTSNLRPLYSFIKNAWFTICSPIMRCLA